MKKLLQMFKRNKNSGDNGDEDVDGEDSVEEEALDEEAGENKKSGPIKRLLQLFKRKKKAEEDLQEEDREEETLEAEDDSSQEGDKVSPERKIYQRWYIILLAWTLVIGLIAGLVVDLVMNAEKTAARRAEMTPSIVIEIEELSENQHIFTPEEEEAFLFEVDAELTDSMENLLTPHPDPALKIGRASCRERVYAPV